MSTLIEYMSSSISENVIMESVKGGFPQIHNPVNNDFLSQQLVQSKQELITASHPTSTCMWYKLKDLGQEVVWQEDMTRVLLYTSFYSPISHVIAAHVTSSCNQLIQNHNE